MHKINDKVIAWLPPETIEPEALQQTLNTASMPFVFMHVAVMPDTHYGRGATVGTVLATEGAIVPAVVGVDIGCGMIAVKTSLKSTDAWNTPENRKKIREGIERRVPMSAGHSNKKITSTAQKRIEELEAMEGIETADKICPDWRLQLGTLGSGNHFIEVCVDTEENIWVTLHSGSRGVGNKIAMHYIKIAQELCEKAFISLPDRDLAYLVEGTPEFDAYIRDLRWAQHFALLNREEMLDRVMAEVATIALGDYTKANELEGQRINCHHNFTQIERHFGKNVWISRKGAIEASEGKMGMIPGSMGTVSYIVSGLGNRLSFNSSPHGAGRRMSRKKAGATFTMEDFDKAMEGIEHRRSDKLLDELPLAYKDIDEVMENAKELVKIEATLKQIINAKGD